VVAVEDTTRALGALARGHRDRFEGPVIAVTGSNGKTSTKEMIHCILSVPGPCLKNPGNLNNEYGLPLSLLARAEEERTAVVELGMNHRGEIARLAAIARPDIAVITNIGTAHIEFFKDQAEIALEKGDLVAALEPTGVAVLNRDDALAFDQGGRVRGRTMSFGRHADADVRAEDVTIEEGGLFSFRLLSPEGNIPIRVRGLAETTISNSLAAAAASLAAGARLEHIQQGLAKFEGVPGRMMARRLSGGAHIIDDSYNANPQSLKNALQSLARLKGRGRSIAILGDMGELGEISEEAHAEIGSLVAELGIDQLFAIGKHSRGLAEAAILRGMSRSKVRVESKLEVLAEEVAELVQCQDWILVKGSRSMQLERVVEALTSEESK
jgi:UDP-N-acetylmuramoyl-tripeptide--D-alanyl-D-alanine ligase